MVGIQVFSNLHLESSPLLSVAWLSSAADSDLLLISNFSQGWILCTKAGRSWARDVFPPRTQTALFVAVRAWWKYNLFNLICLTLAILPLPFRFLVCVCDTFFLLPENWAPYISWSGCRQARNLPLYEAFKVIIYNSKMIGYVSVSAWVYIFKNAIETFIQKINYMCF